MIDDNALKEAALTRGEYERIVELIGREPNLLELGMYGTMWSEHCSYKSSKPVLRLFPTKGKRVLQGPGENAGAVDIGDGLAVVFKIESHNHPSAIEPYQGAATGVGGIIRDIFTMGARPIALLDSLRFGNPEDKKTRYLIGGIVSGIGGYGNCMGIPTVGGETKFHPSYQGNPLVNAMCIGIIRKDGIMKSAASGEGNPVILVGARTGKDGIHGVTFASEELSEKSAEDRPAVQVGDPFTEKLLLEACLEVLGTGYVVGMQDLGGGGLTCATCETASKGDSGMDVDVSLVPRREENMAPYHVMLSESQERMLVIVRSGTEGEAKKIFDKWGLQSTIIGKVTGNGMLRIMEGDRTVADIPAKSLTEGAPVYERESRMPEYLEKLQNADLSGIFCRDVEDALLRILGSPNVSSKQKIFQQYDHGVQANSIVLPGGDAAVIRIRGTGKYISASTDCNSLYCYLDPFLGGLHAVAEAARNVSCAGGEPVGMTNCLNFGNPEKPEIFWQFRKCAEGLSKACESMEIPVTGGNVSFYNENEGTPIHPTPVVGIVGVGENYCTQGFKHKGDIVALLGVTKNEIGGSEYLRLVHSIEAGRPPDLDLDLEIGVQSAVREAISQNILSSAHDCSEGGLAVALAESCISGDIGASIDIKSALAPDRLLFSESASRIIVSLNGENLGLLEDIAQKYNIPMQEIGKVGGDELIINDLIDISVEKLEDRWSRGI